MRNTILPFSCLAAVFALGASAQAAVVFNADFDNGTSGVVDDIGDLGSPSVGSFAFENAATATYGDVSTAVSGDKAFTTGNDPLTRNVITPAISSGTTVEASPGTSFNGSAATNRLYANFAASSIEGGNGATVQFDYGSYGTQNLGVVKSLIVRGLSSGGDEVFETLITMGSSGGTRRVYAREAGDTTFTRTGTSAGTFAGTQVFTNVAGYNSTNPANEPANLNTLTITVVDGQVTYSSESGTAGGTLSFGQNSLATDIAQLEFTSWTHNQGGNSGYWLDNLSVDTIIAVPEPSSTALLGLGGLALIFRRRK